MGDRAVAREIGGLYELIIPINGKLFGGLVDHRLQEGEEVFRIKRGSAGRDPARQIQRPENFNAVIGGNRFASLR